MKQGWRWGAASDGAAPQTPIPAWLPLLGSTGGSQRSLRCGVTPRASLGPRWLTPAACFGSRRRVAHPCRPGSVGAPGLVPPSPWADGTAAATRSSNPPQSVFHLPPRFPGRCTPPPLGAICLVKLKSNPFDVSLPTPSQLPAKNAGDFSLSPAADKSQIVPVAPFEVADTSVWLRAPSLPGPSSGYVGNPPGERYPQGSHSNRAVGLPQSLGAPCTSLGPKPGGVTGSSCQHPAGPTSAVGEPVERVALVAEALEATGGVDAEVVTGPVEGALVNIWRKGKGGKVRAGGAEGQPPAQGLSPSCSTCSSKLGAALECSRDPARDASGIQHWDAPGTLHWDALGCSTGMLW